MNAAFQCSLFAVYSRCIACKACTVLLVPLLITACTTCTAQHAQHNMHSTACTAQHAQHSMHSTACTAFAKHCYSSGSDHNPALSSDSRSPVLLAVQVPAAVLQVTVQPCGLGQIPSADQTQCMLCPSSSYSFTPLVDDCKPCPAQAKCIGGATLVPLQQWHSAPDSDHIVPCPNNNACAGSTSALLACQNATYQARLDVEQVGLHRVSSALDVSLFEWCFADLCIMVTRSVM